jgi:hypothetical protein
MTQSDPELRKKMREAYLARIPMGLSRIAKYGAEIKNTKDWPLDHPVIVDMSHELAKQIFEKLSTSHDLFKGYSAEILENLFILAVCLEKHFCFNKGSVTPTVPILKALGEINPDAWTLFGNWAGENRGDNPYTPFGYRYGFRRYHDLLLHRITVQEKTQKQAQRK